MEWHGAIAIYVIGTLALIISAVHTAVTSQEKGTLMNGFELEKNLDEKKYRQVKTLLLALQCFLLILYVVLFIFFRHYLVALIGLFFCAILPLRLRFWRFRKIRISLSIKNKKKTRRKSIANCILSERRDESGTFFIRRR